MAEYVYQNTYLYFCIFAFVTSITPGPNNLMLLSSCLNFGFRSTVPHIIGAPVGLFILLISVGYGIGSIVSVFSELSLLFKIVGGSYLVFLSYKLSLSRSFGTVRKNVSRPLRIWEAILFQLINPKSWAVALSAMAIFVSDRTSVFWIMLISTGYALINFPCLLVWASFGQAMRHVLSSERALARFNLIAGLALLLCVVPMLLA